MFTVFPCIKCIFFIQMLDKCPMPRRRNSFMNSFLILLCLLFSLVSKSALQIQYFRYVFSSTISEGRLSQLQQRKWFHLALPSFSFSKLNGHRCSWMTISWVHTEYKQSHSLWLQYLFCVFFPSWWMPIMSLYSGICKFCFLWICLLTAG